MKSFDQMPYHPMTEQIVDILCERSQNKQRMFFRIACQYYWGVLASQMHTKVVGWGSTPIPLNIYALNLGVSGFGKGFSTGLIESEVISKFRANFMDNTFHLQAETNINALAKHKALHKGTDITEETERLIKEFNAAGALMFSFDDATMAAVKQMRHKLIIAGSGAVNLQVDEVGAKLVNQEDVLAGFLELYDTGKMKDKLIKNGQDNQRVERIEGQTPANMLLFGTPSKVMDGGKTQEYLEAMLEMGYARRCLFGYSTHLEKDTTSDAQTLVQLLTNSKSDAILNNIATHLEQLADYPNLSKEITIQEAEAVYLMEYKINCSERAEQFKDHEFSLKAEMDHRYFKVLKLAGCYAFLDYSPVITIDHLDYAIRIVEDSGEHFKRLMTPEYNYEKLAKYLAALNQPVTLPDLEYALPYFRGSRQQKEYLIEYATAWGYKNNVVIKKSFDNNIMFLAADSLKQTNIDEMIMSISTRLSEGYEAKRVPFEQLHLLATNNEYHWCSHHFQGEIRRAENALPLFNMIVLDIDGTMPLNVAQDLLKQYRAFFYTTKSHTEEVHRYRIILPINYEVEMDREEYNACMDAVLQTLPFECDPATKDIARKWMCNEGEYFYQEGELFDILPFIPNTSRSDERQQAFQNQSDLDNLERWVLNHTGSGNRNDQIYKYAMVLADAGKSLEQIGELARSLNNKLSDRLSDEEIMNTVLKSVSNKMNRK